MYTPGTFQYAHVKYVVPGNKCKAEAKKLKKKVGGVGDGWALGEGSVSPRSDPLPRDKC